MSLSSRWNERVLSRYHSIAELREGARRRLPRPVFDFMDGGAESEETLRRNTAAFDEEVLIPRCLVDVVSVRTATRVLGQDIAWPVICAPTGASRLFHSEGELAVARAAGASGTLYCLSTGATYSLEDVAAASPAARVFQLHFFRDRDLTFELMERCRRAKYSALCLTVDVPVAGKRERDLRWGFGLRPRWTARTIASYTRHPSWVMKRLGRRALRLAHLGHRAALAGAWDLDPSITWKDVRGLADSWRGPFALKGVMSGEDAARAADAGVTTVIVSNHGGRQLDGAAASLEALPEVVRAVGGRVEVVLDGGVRRGVHVLKALARGATACSIGRPYLYGLSVAGEAGVAKALETLRTELVRAMQLSGCVNVREASESLLRCAR